MTAVCKQTLLLTKNFKRVQYLTASVTGLIALSNSHHIFKKIFGRTFVFTNFHMVELSNLKSAIAGLLASLL